MSETIDTMERQLAALATGLCQDSGIDLRVDGDRWSYDAWRQILTVPATTLAALGQDFCAGRLVNEIGHYWLTRHHLFQSDFPLQSIARMLLSALDDARVNDWMVARYPGARPWLDAVSAAPQEHIEPGADPLIIEFARECSLEPERDWEPASYPVSARVAHALDATRQARQEYASILPTTRPGSPTIEEPTRVYMREVTPRLLRGYFIPGPFEAEVRICALEALELAEYDIFPAAIELLEIDRENIARWLAQNPELVDQARMGQLDGQLDLRNLQPGAPANLQMLQLAADVLDDLGGMSRTLLQNSGDWGMPQPGRVRWSPGPRRRRKLSIPPATLDDYERARSRISRQIDALVDRLERVLVPRRRLGRRSGYASGRQVDMRRLMAFDADPRQYNKLWIRTTVPERRRVAFSLLVDLSGSMDGEKAETALLGTVLMVETLVRLRVPFAVNGFQANVIPFAGFNDPFGNAMRKELATMPSRADNCNDDGPCLLQVAEALLEEAVDDRFLIVVSDGQPSERETSEQDLRDAIAHLNSESTPLHLVGIGLGPDTEHVLDYYPDARACVPVDSFADVIGDLVARGLHV